VNKEDRYDSTIKFYASLNFLDWMKVKALLKACGALDYVREGHIEDVCSKVRGFLTEFGQDDRKALAAWWTSTALVEEAIRQAGEKWMSALPASTTRAVLEVNRIYVEYQHEELQKGRT
jgi:hypothetical protein